jgi:hypothetical protein
LLVLIWGGHSEPFLFVFILRVGARGTHHGGGGGIGEHGEPLLLVLIIIN